MIQEVEQFVISDEFIFKLLSLISETQMHNLEMIVVQVSFIIYFLEKIHEGMNSKYFSVY